MKIKSAVISNCKVVYDGDSVVAPCHIHGASTVPGTILHIVFQDVVVEGVVRKASRHATSIKLQTLLQFVLHNDKTMRCNHPGSINFL